MTWLETDDDGFLRMDSVDHFVVHGDSGTIWVIKADDRQLSGVWTTQAEAQSVLESLVAVKTFPH